MTVNAVYQKVPVVILSCEYRQLWSFLYTAFTVIKYA
jgi:hypothetical protein